MVTIYGNEVESAIGAVIRADGWRFGKVLQACDWSEAEYRIEAGLGTRAVNVKVTGRTYQRRDGDYWVRIEIEFVGDGEPSTFVGGWMKRN